MPEGRDMESLVSAAKELRIRRVGKGKEGNGERLGSLDFLVQVVDEY